MKRILYVVMVLVMLLGAVSALAEGAIDAKVQTVRGNASLTVESYPEARITPVYVDYIISRYKPEEYPARFLRFAPPEGATALEFRYDESQFVVFDTLVQYSYFAYDRASFELFLEKAEVENIILDGSDGVAIYFRPDNRRASAMIDIKEQFGGTAKLQIEIYDHTGDLKADDLQKLITDEVKRVQAAMTVEDLDGYWSVGKYSSVELCDVRNDVTLNVNTDGWILTKLSDKRLVVTAPVEGSSTASDTEISIDSYLNADAIDATLADGTEYKAYNTDYNGYAYFYLKDGKSFGQVYLTIKLACAPDEFATKLEEAYARITIYAAR